MHGSVSVCGLGLRFLMAVGRCFRHGGMVYRQAVTGDGPAPVAARRASSLSQQVAVRRFDHPTIRGFGRPHRDLRELHLLLHHFRR